MRLNLGSGTGYKKGYINLDINELEKPDVVCDITTGLPFKDNLIDEVYASNFFEHIDNVDAVLNECRRVLKVGGKLIIIVPHFSSSSAHYYQHKVHFRALDSDEFKGFKLNKRYISLAYPLGFINISNYKCIRIYEHFNIINTLFPASRVYWELEKQ